MTDCRRETLQNAVNISFCSILLPMWRYSSALKVHKKYEVNQPEPLT